VNTGRVSTAAASLFQSSRGFRVTPEVVFRVVFIHEGHEENRKDTKNCLKKRDPSRPDPPARAATALRAGFARVSGGYSAVACLPKASSGREYNPAMPNPSALVRTIRPAVRADDAAIRALVRREHLNPLGRNWRNFLVAEDEAGRLIAIGAVKTHGDGSRELASIATVPEARGRGGCGHP
jgi:hypothetical protein